MAAKTNGTSPDKRREYDEAFKAELLDGGYFPGLVEARLEKGSQFR
jgi:hypothetical protein